MKLYEDKILVMFWYKYEDAKVVEDHPGDEEDPRTQEQRERERAINRD